jgi:hypothetical protein
MSPRCSPQLNAFCAGPALDGESPIRYFLSDRLLNCVDFLGARLASTFTPVAKTFRPCFHEPAPPGPRRPAPSRVTLKSKKSCSLAEKQPFRGDVRCLTMVPPCRGQFETGSRRATFVRRPQWLVFSSSRGDRNRFLAAPAHQRRQFRSRICFRSVSARESGPDWLTVCN